MMRPFGELGGQRQQGPSQCGQAPCHHALCATTPTLFQEQHPPLPAAPMQVPTRHLQAGGGWRAEQGHLKSGPRQRPSLASTN